MINRKSARTLINKGSDIYLIRSELVTQKSCINKTRLQIRTADNKRMQVLGEATIECVIENRRLLIPFIVIKEMPQEANWHLISVREAKGMQFKDEKLIGSWVASAQIQVEEKKKEINFKQSSQNCLQLI